MKYVGKLSDTKFKSKKFLVTLPKTAFCYLLKEKKLQIFKKDASKLYKKDVHVLGGGGGVYVPEQQIFTNLKLTILV